MDSNQWNTYADLYNQGIGVSGDELRQKVIHPIIYEYLGDYEGLTIVDAGCGNGYLSKNLAALAKKVIGLDSSKQLLQIAQKNLSSFSNVLLKHVDLITKWPVAAKSVDVVIINMVIQYLPELDNFAKESSRVLKNSGSLLVILDHPGHALFLRAQELVGKKNEKFLTPGSYFSSGKRKKKSLWDKAILEYYHRPIKDYINPFTSHFCLERMEEVSEDSEMPRILGLKWRKR